MRFNKKKPFTLPVEVTKEDWVAAKAERTEARASFDVCARCVAGRAINRALSAMFPKAKIYATCASGTAAIRRHKKGVSAGVLGQQVMGLDDCLPVTPHLANVVGAFDGHKGGEPTPSFNLHFIPEEE